MKEVYSVTFNEEISSENLGAWESIVVQNARDLLRRLKKDNGSVSIKYNVGFENNKTVYRLELHYEMPSPTVGD